MRGPTVYIEVGPVEYKLRPDYTPGRGPNLCGHPDNWDPGDPPELELPTFPGLYVNGEDMGAVPYDLMVLDYASEARVSLDIADRAIYDKCMDACASYDWEPDYEEYDPEPDYSLDD